MALRSTRTLAVTALVAAAVVGFGGASYATTGHFLVLGHGNSSHKTTTVAMTGHGPALRLKTKKSSPPLAVTSSRLVKHLNAAEVGGMTAADLRGTAALYIVTPASSSASSLSAVLPIKAGKYMLSYTADLDASADVRCSVEFHGDGNDYVMLNYGLNDSGFSTATATSAVNVTAADLPVSLSCNSFDSSDLNFNDTPFDKTYVTALPLNAITGSNSAPASFRRAHVRSSGASH
jgi:hypothetical protein